MSLVVDGVELVIGLVGLGSLPESALLSMFGAAQAHVLTGAKGITLHGIVDRNGELLYPGYYRTHVTIPPDKPLTRYEVWDRVAVACHAACYGGMILESEYCLGRAEEVGKVTSRAELLERAKALPSMRSNSLFIVESRRGGDQVLSPPKAGLVDHLDELPDPPASLSTFQEARASGVVDPSFHGTFRSTPPISYEVAPGRDGAPGHALMFAKFTDIMDYAERKLLTERVWPVTPHAVADHLQLLEREVFYFNNCYAPTMIDLDLEYRIDRTESDFHGSDRTKTSVAIMTGQGTLYERGSGALLAAFKVRKLLVVPTAKQSLLRDAERIVRAHSTRTSTE